MTIWHWLGIGLLLWLAIVALILACARKMRMPECGAEEAADSVRGALTECPDPASTAKAWAGAKQVRRVRAGG